MKYNWNNDKNKFLKETRFISFEDIVEYIENGFLIKEIEHPNKTKYPNQKVYLVNINNYVYFVPYVMEENGNIFLKTVYPSRKWTDILINK